MNTINIFPHENLLSFLDFSIDSKSKQISILMDYIPNNLYDFIGKNSITEEMLKSISSQIIAGVNHLHNLGYLHRDLKSINILIGKNTDGKILVKISDYGLGVNISQNNEFLGNCGSNGFKAPEMLIGSPVYYKSLDVWSIGVVILEILFKGENIFYEQNSVDSLMKIMEYFGIDKLKDIIPFAKYFPFYDYYNKEIKKKKNVTQNENIKNEKKNIFQNLNLEDIIRKKQTIIKEENIDLFINFIKKILVLDPMKRAKLEELKNDPWLNSN
jgi:serine/threonine protein kinase